MKRANVLGVALVVASALATAPVTAQTVGADLGLYSSYVWRGLSLTNKPVAQPDVYVTFPAGKASLTLAGWANIDLGKYDDPNNDISESGGLSSFNFAEFDPYAEISYPVGKASLTGGITGYFYPNDAGLTSDFNTWEVYGKVSFDEVPLSPKLSVWYDIDKIDGLYAEAAISHSLAAGKDHTLDLGATAGFNSGQDANLDANGNPQAEFFNFQDNGFTHLDLSAGFPITAGAFSITPVFHFLINGDEFVKVTSPTKSSDTKIWGGVTISWSKGYGAAAEEPSDSTTSE
jgi:uncharacterized protein Gcw-chp